MTYGFTSQRRTHQVRTAAALAALATIASSLALTSVRAEADQMDASTSGAPSAVVTAAAEPFWSDEFSGPSGARPDKRAWNREVGNRVQRGWWNNELQYYTAGAANSSMTGTGKLLIQAKHAGRRSDLPCWPRGRCHYTSARLTTEGTVSLTHGRVDVRAKLPTGKGLLPAIWMLGNNGRGYPEQGEIDIVEVVGGQPRTAYATVHGPGYLGDEGLGATLDLGARASKSFHVYSLVKEPNSLTWLVNDKPYLTVTSDDIPADKEWVFEQDMHLLLNVAVGGNWPGDPGSSTKFPATMKVDYVRMYGQGIVNGVEVSSTD